MNNPVSRGVPDLVDRIKKHNPKERWQVGLKDNHFAADLLKQGTL